MSREPKGLFFLCCYCRNELNESQIFDFRGAVGCENCVRSYYRDRPADEVDSQLRIRQRNALIWLKRNRRTLEKDATKRMKSDGKARLTVPSLKIDVS
jgi:hypothetical protein